MGEGGRRRGEAAWQLTEVTYRHAAGVHSGSTTASGFLPMSASFSALNCASAAIAPAALALAALGVEALLPAPISIL